MKREPIRFTGFPKCSTQIEFDGWLVAARWAKMPIPMASFCTDCLPSYQFKMKICGRCEHPEIKFRYDEDGFFEGYIPEVKRTKGEASQSK